MIAWLCRFFAPTEPDPKRLAVEALRVSRPQIAWAYVRATATPVVMRSLALGTFRDRSGTLAALEILPQDDGAWIARAYFNDYQQGAHSEGRSATYEDALRDLAERLRVMPARDADLTRHLGALCDALNPKETS